MNDESRSSDIRMYLLALLHADNNAPISGNIMLVKQAFLLFKEIVPGLAEEAHFFPYQWGPYSNVVAQEVNELVKEGCISTEKRGRDEVFALTSKGIELAHMAIQDIPQEILQDICRMKKTTQEIGLKRLLRFVYSQYPQYSRYSRGKELYVAC